MKYYKKNIWQESALQEGTQQKSSIQEEGTSQGSIEEETSDNSNYSNRRDLEQNSQILNPENIRVGIIYSEILSKPKALRRRRF